MSQTALSQAELVVRAIAHSELALSGARAALVTAVEGCPRPGAKLLVAADSDAEGTLGDGELDAAALAVALASDAGYIGAMGSRRTQAKRRERLLAAGVDQAQLVRVAAPIGLDLGALTAAETALSIMGEIVAVQHGRSGGRLIDARGRIHDAVAA